MKKIIFTIILAAAFSVVDAQELNQTEAIKEQLSAA